MPVQVSTPFLLPLSGFLILSDAVSVEIDIFSLLCLSTCHQANFALQQTAAEVELVNITVTTEWFVAEEAAGLS